MKTESTQYYTTLKVLASRLERGDIDGAKIHVSPSHKASLFSELNVDDLRKSENRAESPVTVKVSEKLFPGDERVVYLRADTIAAV